MDGSLSVVIPNLNSQEFTTVGTTNWTCPVGVFSVLVIGCGGGGGGAGGNGAQYGGNGQPGVYGMRVVATTPGSIYPIVVGTGGGGGGGPGGGAGGVGNYSGLQPPGGGTFVGGAGFQYGAGGSANNWTFPPDAPHPGYGVNSRGGGGGGGSASGNGGAGGPGFVTLVWATPL